MTDAVEKFEQMLKHAGLPTGMALDLYNSAHELGYTIGPRDVDTILVTRVDIDRQMFRSSVRADCAVMDFAAGCVVPTHENMPDDTIRDMVAVEIGNIVRNCVKEQLQGVSVK